MDEVLSLHMGAPEKDAEGSIGKALRAKSNIARRPLRARASDLSDKKGAVIPAKAVTRESRATPLTFRAPVFAGMTIGISNNGIGSSGEGLPSPMDEPGSPHYVAVFARFDLRYFAWNCCFS